MMCEPPHEQQGHVSGSDLLCLVSKATLQSELLLSLISVSISQHRQLVSSSCVCTALIEVRGRPAAALLSHECPQTEQDPDHTHHTSEPPNLHTHTAVITA